MSLPINVWLVHPEKEMCDAFREQFDQLPNVTIHQSYFEDLPPHDCFVTAANSFGIMTAGIDAAVVRFHGESLMTRVQHRILDEYLGEQRVGTAFLEPTGTAGFPYIAHAPTMRVPGSINRTENVYAATWAALLCVYRHNATNRETIDTIAFPAMGTGFGSVPYVEAARQMAVAYDHYLNPPHRFDWDVVVQREKRITGE